MVKIETSSGTHTLFRCGSSPLQTFGLKETAKLVTLRQNEESEVRSAFESSGLPVESEDAFRRKVDSNGRTITARIPKVAKTTVRTSRCLTNKEEIV